MALDDVNIGNPLYADPTDPVLPATGFALDHEGGPCRRRPPDRLSEPGGVSWPYFGESITENGTVDHLRQLFEAAKAAGITVAVSPHYYYPTDHAWRFGGPLREGNARDRDVRAKGATIAGRLRE
jgi:hypothetical protein